MALSFSLAEARRIAIAAQGLAAARPARVTRQHVRRVIQQLGLIQIDFVNVLVPAHYLVPFSRLGAYDRGQLDHLVYRTEEFTEQWAHEASIVPMEAWPLLRHRMEARGERPYAAHAILRKQPGYRDWVVEQIGERGPLAGAALSGPGGGSGRVAGDWYKSIQRIVLEGHFGRGVLAVTDRLPSFARVYDLAERAIPDAHFARRVTAFEAQLELMARAARSCGIATATDLADYYRMKPAEARACLPLLLERGDIRLAAVEGWKEPAYLHREAKLPREVEARAVLSPFDPLVWFRPRLERLFGFEYRLEIYTPAAKRRWGYYVLPFLLGDRLVARVDLKADRARGELVAVAVHYEAGVKRSAVLRELRAELAAVAGWLGLERVVMPRGPSGGAGSRNIS